MTLDKLSASLTVVSIEKKIITEKVTTQKNNCNVLIFLPVRYSKIGGY